MSNIRDLETQAALEERINAALRERQTLLQQSNQTRQNQQNIMERIRGSIQGVNEDLRNQQEAQDNLNDRIREGQEERDNQGPGGLGDIINSLKSGKKQAGGLSGLFGKMNKEMTYGRIAAVGMASGLVKGFKNAFSIMGMVNSLIGSVVSGIFKIGAAIIAIPFRIWGGLVEMAQEGGGGVDALRQQLEKLRGEMGDLNKGPAADLKAGLKDLRRESKNLAGTGLRLSTVYGYGREGLAKALEELQGHAKALGPLLNRVSDQFRDNASEILMLNKGLGLSSEQFASFARKAGVSGKSITKQLTEVGSMSIQMGDQFGISTKDMAQGMAEMAEGFADFGHMSVKQLGATTAYMKKLGLEMKELSAVSGIFEDFESGADAAAQLNQALGMQVDTMKMLNATPADRIDQLRDSFYQTGRNIKDLLPQEKKLLMQQTGLSEAALENAFAQDMQGTSYEDFEDAAADAEEKQLSQVEVMDKLATSIEKLVQGGGGQVKGFWDAFTQGFEKGFKRNKDFRAMLREINKALRVMTQFGIQVGNMVADVFGSGGFDIFGDMKKMLDASALGKFLGITVDKHGQYQTTGTGVLGIFKKLKDGLLGKGDYSVEQAFTDIGLEVDKFLDSKGGIWESMKKKLEAIGVFLIDTFFEVLAAMGPRVIEAITNAANVVSRWLTDEADREVLPPGEKGPFEKALDRGMKKLDKLDIDPMFKALTKMWDKLWKKISPVLEEILYQYLYYTVFLPTLLQMTMTTGLPLLGKAIFSKIFTKAAGDAAVKGGLWPALKGLGGWITKTAGPALMTAGSSIVGGISSGISAAAAATGGIAASIGGAVTTGLTGIGSALGVAGTGAALVGGAAIVAAVGAGIAAADVEKTLGPVIDEKFGEDTMGAAAARSGTAVAKFFTLGLLDDETYKEIAETTGGWGEAFQEGMESMGLGFLSDFLTTELRAFFDLFAGFGRALGGLWDIIAGIFTLDAERIFGGFGDLLGGLADMVIAIWDALVGKVMFVWDVIKLVGEAFVQFWELIKAGGEVVARWWASTWDWMVGTWNSFTQTISDGFSYLGELWESFKVATIGTVTNMWTAITDKLKALGQFFKRTWENIKSWTITPMKNAWNYLLSLPGKAMATFRKWKKNFLRIFNNIFGPVIRMIKTAKKWWDWLWGSSKKDMEKELEISSPSKWMIRMMGHLLSPVKSGVEAMGNEMSNMWDAPTMSVGAKKFGTKIEGALKKAQTAVADNPIIAVAEEVIKEYEELQQKLHDASSLNMTAAIESFAQATGMSTDKLTINNEPIQINANFVVTLDAGKLAKVLVDKNVMNENALALGTSSGE